MPWWGAAPDAAVPGARAVWTGPLDDGTRHAVVADASNHLVAVSPVLLELLGHGPGLVGRRLVELVPPRLREAHVAGFTRHLATGERRILDTPVRLPVLAADGSEITCDVLIHADHDAGGRTVFVAWISPVGA